MGDSILRDLCNACHMGALPDLGLDFTVMQYHNKLHPARAIPGAGDQQYWIENMVPDGKGAFLIKFNHSYKLSWESEHQSIH